LEKVACGAFSDISSVVAGKKRGFCRLRVAANQLRIAGNRLRGVGNRISYMI
jgi:hypothetical protein